MKELRNRLESTAFPDLGAMMEGYAQAAVELARKEFKRNLDFSADSVDALDDILVVVSESPEKDLDFEVRSSMQLPSKAYQDAIWKLPLLSVPLFDRRRGRGPAAG